MDNKVRELIEIGKLIKGNLGSGKVLCINTTFDKGRVEFQLSESMFMELFANNHEARKWDGPISDMELFTEIDGIRFMTLVGYRQEANDEANGNG